MHELRWTEGGPESALFCLRGSSAYEQQARLMRREKRGRGSGVRARAKGREGEERRSERERESFKKSA